MSETEAPASLADTVNNRLTKITELLGMDPTTTRGVVGLSAALGARRIG